MKKLFALLLSGILLASTIPIYSNAAEANTTATPIIVGEPTPGSQKEPTTAGLEAAILAVKDLIAIPEQYSEFNYNFYDGSVYSDSYWTLTWSNPIDESSITVNCDENYHISYFYKYDSSQKNNGVAKYLKSELRATVDDFIKKIAPETANKLELLNVTYEGIYGGSYVYNYQRRNNGIDFPENNVSVSINSVTGEITSATINWLYDSTVPSSAVKITKEEAMKLIKKNMTMKLVYRSNNIGIYDARGNNSATKAFLVYEPSLSYISVDAKTGDLYLTKSQWIDTNTTNAKSDASTSDKVFAGSSSQKLTEQEVSKIDELKNIISKAKAIDTITSNPSLYLDKSLKSYTANLYKSTDYTGKTSYVWNISLSDPREIDYTKEKDTYRAYASASVDAKTGKILSFYSSLKSNYDSATGVWDKVKIVYNKEQSKAVLEKFLKTQIKDHFNNSIISSQNDDYVAYYAKDQTPVYGGYNYQYNRVNENVEYPNNNIYGSVDGVSGKIYSYSSYWDENIVFEPTKGAMTADQAIDAYLANDGFGLKYEINTINKYDSNNTLSNSYYDYSEANKVENEIRLVYRPDVTPSGISPFTGKQLNYDGTEYTVDNATYSYTDIDTTKEKRNILILADMNVGFEGGKFLPDQAITIGEMNSFLQDIGYGYGYIVKDDADANIVLTKEVLAKIFIDKLGLTKLAKLSGIYTTGYQDEKSIGEEYFGAVALAKGTGVLTADADNKFNPKSNITREQAVTMLFNFITKAQDVVLN